MLNGRQVENPISGKFNITDGVSGEVGGNMIVSLK